eukprot:36150-Rhodomonas_salina.11
MLTTVLPALGPGSAAEALLVSDTTFEKQGGVDTGGWRNAQRVGEFVFEIGQAEGQAAVVIALELQERSPISRSETKDWRVEAEGGCGIEPQHLTALDRDVQRVSDLEAREVADDEADPPQSGPSPPHIRLALPFDDAERHFGERGDDEGRDELPGLAFHRSLRKVPAADFVLREDCDVVDAKVLKVAGLQNLVSALVLVVASGRADGEGLERADLGVLPEPCARAQHHLEAHPAGIREQNCGV